VNNVNFTVYWEQIHHRIGYKNRDSDETIISNNKGTDSRQMPITWSGNQHYLDKLTVKKIANCVLIGKYNYHYCWVYFHKGYWITSLVNDKEQEKMNKYIFWKKLQNCSRNSKKDVWILNEATYLISLRQYNSNWQRTCNNLRRTCSFSSPWRKEI